MGLGDNIQQAASAVGGAAKGVVSAVGSAVADVATDTAKTVAKTPLDILEEILGSKAPVGTGDTGAENKESVGGAGATSAQDDAAKMAEIEKMKQDDTQKNQAHIQLHRQRMAEEQQAFQSYKAQEEQRKQAEKQQEEQKKQFEIRQLEQKKAQDYQLKAAQDANNAEKSRNMGAG